MSCSTIAWLKGQITPMEIANFLVRKEISTEVNCHKESKEKADYMKTFYNGPLEKPWTRSGIIMFTKDMLPGSIYYSYSSYNCFDGLDSAIMSGKDHESCRIQSETTYLSTGVGGIETEILKELLEYFGGWFLENDCSGKDSEFFVGKLKNNVNMNIEYPEVFGIISKTIATAGEVTLDSLEPDGKAPDYNQLALETYNKIISTLNNFHDFLEKK